MSFVFKALMEHFHVEGKRRSELCCRPFRDEYEKEPTAAELDEQLGRVKPE